jgi:hypothetical protein
MTEGPFRAPAIRPYEERVRDIRGLAERTESWFIYFYFIINNIALSGLSRAAWIRESIPLIGSL